MSEQVTVYMCTKCDASFQTEEEMKFCSKCGASVSLVEGGRIRQVLLVDDSMLARTKIKAVLKSLGCQVTEAGDGVEGLEAAETSNPDLIILDVEMPRMGGLKALEILRKSQRFVSTPVIMLTGNADVDVVAKAVSAGATNYLLKNTPVTELINRLKQYVEDV